MVLPLMGVSRQPRIVKPSSRTIFSMIPSQMSRSCVSTGRKTIPTPYSPGEGSEKPRLAARWLAALHLEYAQPANQPKGHAHLLRYDREYYERWIDRALQNEGIESYVVDAASLEALRAAREAVAQSKENFAARIGLAS